MLGMGKLCPLSIQENFLIMFRLTTLTAIIAVMSLFIGTDQANAYNPCSCGFEVDITGGSGGNAGTPAESYNVTVEIESNGSYELSGDHFSSPVVLEICNSGHNGDNGPTSDSHTVSGLTAGTGYQLSIKNLHTDCVQNVTYDLVNLQLVITSGAGSCNEGCTADDCDMWVKPRQTKAYVYAYPHQGVDHQISWRIKPPPGFIGLFTDMPVTQSHYTKIENLAPNTEYQVRIRERCGRFTFTPWSEILDFTTLP